MNKSPSESNQQEKLFVLQELLCLKLEDIIEKLELNLKCDEFGCTGTCPIHMGDNPRALNLYRTGHTHPGYWQCLTKHCEKIFQPTIIGFIRGVLSRKNGWQSREDKAVSFPETLKWCCELVGQKIDELKINPAEIEKRKFAAGISKMATKTAAGAGLTRQQIRQRLQIPAEYFIKRGWSKEILDHYDIGLCNNSKLPFYNRIVVPVYDNQHKSSIGFIARSIYDKCDKCDYYHDNNSNCPSQKIEQDRSTKWLNSRGFNRESYLYNFWSAKDYIEDSNTVCICEGPGDIWRLEEAGIKCGVAMFGTALTDRQQVLLETSGAMKILLLTDNDEPGHLAAEDIQRKLFRSFKIIRPKFDAHDIGEMKIGDVQLLLRDLI